MNPHGDYRFEDFVVDLEAWKLLRSGTEVHLEPTVLKLLAYLIQHRDRLVTKDELMATVWGDTVVSDSALTKAVARARKALDEDSAHPRYIETVHSLGYRFIGEVEDHTRPAESPGPVKPSAQPRRRLVAALSVAGALSLILVLAWIRFGPAPEPTEPAGIQSLAVLPLDNLSGDPEQDYFAEGLHDVLIADLSRITGLKVISRQSTLRYQESEKSATQIARELDVDALIEGSALLIGDQVKISAQLIHGRTDEHLWAQTYDRDLGDVLTLLGEMASTISGEIEMSLRPPAVRMRSAPGPAASEAYLRGLYQFNRFSVDGFRQSLNFFEQAIEADPEFALAWSALAGAHLMIAYFGDEPPAGAVTRGREAALRALELDDSHFAAHAAMAWVHLFTGNWTAAGQAFERALELNPNDPTTLHGYSDYLLLTGHPEESLAQVRYARVIDPHTPSSNLPLPYHLFMMRQYDEALAECLALVEGDPDYPVHWLLAMVLWQQGMLDESVVAFEKSLARQGQPRLVAALQRGLAEAGPRGAMIAVAAELTALSEETYVDPFRIAATYAQAGEVEAAFLWLEKAVSRGSLELMHLGMRPEFDLLKGDPRFDALWQRAGMSGH
ncbi:MAG: winged helix-turn-helix domain-containing protein [Xanthomonadales bacterium]|nr:winged helix-turn-helix domain-containing protein [Xanthomonadales bacterium]